MRCEPALLILLAACLQGSPMDATSIVQRSVAANRRDWNAAPEYSYVECDRDGDGGRTYEVSMLLGFPYRRLVSIDGKPLSEANEEKQRSRLKQAFAQRRAESATVRAERTAKYERERKRNQLMMEQLATAFDFKLLGQEKAGRYDTYILEATPKPGYRPPNIETEVLTGMRGKLWIDKISFQWVKVEAEVVHPVSIAGFVARVEKGTRFELEKTPVAAGVWLPSHFAMESRARILGVVTRREKEEQTYSGYRKTDATKAGDLY